ncbi:MAG: sulfatase [Planctomycetia bacterium]|nr:sulfatase [Planctomycetia bacterium]
MQRVWNWAAVGSIASILAVTIALVAASLPARADDRPNILFIMADDHAFQALSCYGSKINKTPNLDRLAREGMRFDRCCVTNSLCGPCRAVILTGKYSHLNGFIQNGDRFDGSQQNVAKLLQAAGYQTAIIGKWHLESDPTGFDHWNILIGQGPYYNPPMKTAQGRKPHTGYTTDIITDYALEFLKSGRDRSKPFFLMYHHKAPHREWQPSPKHLTLFDDVTIPEPETLFDDYAGRGTAARTQTMSVAGDLTPLDLKLTPPKNLTPEQLAAWQKAYGPKNEEFKKANLQGKELVRWKYQRYIKDYLRCVASVDENVGRVLDYLDESGLANSTIVIYTADQGFYLGEHGWFDKRFMYRESHGTPLLVRYPGHIKPGSVNDDLALNLDFAETFLDFAGAKVPVDMQGRSLRPLLEGSTPPDWRTSAYYQFYEHPGVHNVHRHFGVATKKFKLMNFYSLKEWELYDLEKDPREMKNVYGDPAYAAVQAELHNELERLRAELKVPEDTRPDKVAGQ